MSPADPASSYRAIENLIARYAELVDAGDFAAVGKLLANAPFTAGAGSVSGPDAIEKMLQENVVVYDDGTPRTKHVTPTSGIELDDEAGTADSRRTSPCCKPYPTCLCSRSPSAATKIASSGAMDSGASSSASANRSRRRHEPPSAPPTR